MQRSRTTTPAMLLTLYGFIYRKETSVTTIAQTIGVDFGDLNDMFLYGKPIPRRLFRQVCSAVGVTKKELLVYNLYEKLG